MSMIHWIRHNVQNIIRVRSGVKIYNVVVRRAFYFGISDRLENLMECM